MEYSPLDRKLICTAAVLALTAFIVADCTTIDRTETVTTTPSRAADATPQLGGNDRVLGGGSAGGPMGQPH